MPRLLHPPPLPFPARLRPVPCSTTSEQQSRSIKGLSQTNLKPVFSGAKELGNVYSNMVSLEHDVLPARLFTARLTLERFDRSDEHYACIMGALNNPTAYERMGDYGIHTLEQLNALCDSTMLLPSVFTKTPDVVVDIAFYYVMRLGHDGDDVSHRPLIGGVSLGHRGAQVPPDIGWALLEAFHSKGYATEAAQELLRFVTQDLGIKEIMAWPGHTNLQSVAVAKKIGLVQGPDVTDQDGEVHAVYVLPGMKMQEGLTVNLYGEDRES